jgi:hypothetical protein
MNIFDDPTTHRAQRVEFSEGEYTTEERHLVKKLASLQESYAMEAKPFIDRLVSIRSMCPTPQMMVTLEQAREFGFTLPNSEVKNSESKTPHHCDNYTPDNWAHQALLLMDEADVLVRFGAANMPDAEKYTKVAKAFWGVCELLADERNKLHNQVQTG